MVAPVVVASVVVGSIVVGAIVVGAIVVGTVVVGSVVVPVNNIAGTVTAMTTRRIAKIPHPISGQRAKRETKVTEILENQTLFLRRQSPREASRPGIHTC